MREDSSFYGRVIADNELVSWLWNKSRADQLRERVRDVVVKKVHGIVISGTDKGAGFCEIRDVVLRKVLQLDQTAGPSAGTIGTVELKHTVNTSVRAHDVLHGLIFSDGGFRKLETEFQGFCNITIHIANGIFDKLRDFLLAE